MLKRLHRVPCLLLAALALGGWTNPEPSACCRDDVVSFDVAGAERDIRAHAAFLADDLLEGRGTGTRGYAIAAQYVAAQLARLGLQPAGDDGTYFQAMKLREWRAGPEVGEFQIRGLADAPEFVVGTDVIVRAAEGEAASAVAAPAVLVGFGIHAPELQHDDFAGVDLHGKIAVVLRGAPQSFPTNPGAHYADSTVKRRELADRGAVGVITLSPPRDEARVPWTFLLARTHFPRMGLLADGEVVDAFPQLRAAARLSSAASSRFLAAAGRKFEEVLKEAEAGQRVAGELGFAVALAGQAELRDIESMNVLATLPGRDPALAQAPLVVTAHLDHVGIGPAVEGDTIYNGAMDNAVGIGIVLTAAEHLARATPPARPVLFAALTAEEMGLLGGMHLARNPPAGVRHYAANINIDMPLFPGPVRDLIGYGIDHTSLGEILRRVAADHGFTVTPDAEPEEVIFVRSDQYAFVLQGVPALFLSAGFRAHGEVDVQAAYQHFMRNRYHRPNDDLHQPIDWPSAAAFAEVSTAFIRAAADADPAPAWYVDDFFGEQFGGDAPRAPAPDIK